MRERPFLTAKWRYLVMLNFEVNRDILHPLVPAGTVLDLFRGRALVSVVGFRFLDTRVLGLPIPAHRNFDEVNLRFYVRREMSDGSVRRGVTFVREIVPRAAIAFVARIAYNEPYLAAPMRSRVPVTVVPEPGRLEYTWRLNGEWNKLGVTAVGTPELAIAESEAEFVTEHYWGYTRQRDGGTVEYEVTHSAWHIWTAHTAVLSADVRHLYGAEFVEALAASPASAFVADGSTVVVHKGRRICGS